MKADMADLIEEISNTDEEIVHIALMIIKARMKRGQYYRWDLGYNCLIKWDDG